MGKLSRFSSILAPVGGAKVQPKAGQIAFTTKGTYTWTVPEGVTSISVVCVGGGGAGLYSGGGGGGLAWRNNILVYPGETYTVTVGWEGNSGVSGGTSWFRNTSTMFAGGGLPGFSWTQPNLASPGGSFVGQGGGNGGDGGMYQMNNELGGLGGGGGAGGYRVMTRQQFSNLNSPIVSDSNGGKGGNGSVNEADPNTPYVYYSQGGYSGAGGGGGGGGSWNTDLSPSQTKGGSGGNGGGVLLTGIGGAAGGQNGPNNGNSLSNPNLTGQSAEYALGYGGGGGGVRGASSVTYNPGRGGAVRIIWPGNLRLFPSNRTTDE